MRLPSRFALSFDLARGNIFEIAIGKTLGFFRVYCEDVFTTKDTKSTKFGLSPEGFWPQGGELII